ncbi:MAG TPA: hypothetical protein VIK95_05625 [Egibacteraceae bacterium]
MTRPPAPPVRQAFRDDATPDDRAADLERYCRRLVARLCRDSWVLRRDCEDLLQEARLLAWQHASHPVAERVIKLRLIDRVRVVYGRTSNAWGRPAKRAAAEATLRSLDEAAAEVQRLAAVGDDVEELVIARDIAARVRRGLAALSDVDQAVILGSVAGRRLQDLARQLGLTESGVSRRRQAARQRLRRALVAV